VAADESKKKVDETTPGTTGSAEAKAAAPKTAKPRAAKPKPKAEKPKADEAKTAKAEAEKPKVAKPKAEKAAKPRAEKAAKPKAEKPVQPEKAAGEKVAAAEKAEKPAKAAKPKAEKAEKPAKAAKPKAEKAAKPKAEKPAKGRKPRAAAAKAEAVEAPVKAERPPKVKLERPVHEPRRGKLGVATVVDGSGSEVATRDLVAARFAVPADVNTLHLVVRGEQAARRRGTASTKTRGEVRGSTAKLFRQKGTGRARVGSVKSPVRTGGGTAFGPKPRSYFIKVNRKVVKKALAMALSNRAENGNLFVAAGLELETPSTRRLNDILTGIDCAAPVLFVTHDEPAVSKSVRNLFYAETAEVGALSTEQVLRARSLVLTEKAFDALNQG
jgi:large subunit ribosomal protein L4